MKELRKAYKISVVKPEVKRPLGKFRNRFEDNIKMNFMDIYLEGVV
jgi:hypothetical protein